MDGILKYETTIETKQFITKKRQNVEDDVLPKSDYLPMRSMKNKRKGIITPFMRFYELKPHFDIKTKDDVSNGIILMKKLKFLNCKKYQPFFLINMYKARVIKDIYIKFNIDEKAYTFYQFIYNSMSCDKINILRRIRERLTLLDVYLLMDLIKCNVLMYNECEYVMYMQDKIYESWLVLKYENAYDITYINVFEKLPFI